MIKLHWNKKKVNFVSLVWSGTDTQCSREVTFSVLHNPYDKNFKNAGIKLGDLVQVFDGKDPIFTGIITDTEKTAAIGTKAYTARDFMHYLLRSIVSRRFANKTAEYITKQVCTEVGVGCKNLAKTGVNIPKLIFDQQSVYDIMMRAYKKASAQTKKKYMPVMDGKKVSVIIKGKDSGVTLDQSSDITDATYHQTTDDMINVVKIYNDKMVQIGQVKNDTNVKKYGIYQEAYTKEKGVDAKAAAKSLLTGVTREATVEALGNIKAVSGKSIVIYDKATGLSGKFYITSDSHTFENGTHKMTLDLVWRNTMESGAETESDKKSAKKKTHTSTAVAYYLEGGTAYHSSASCSSLDGKSPIRTTVSAVLKIVNKRGKNKGKPKYKKCAKCWR